MRKLGSTNLKSGTNKRNKKSLHCIAGLLARENYMGREHLACENNWDPGRKIGVCWSACLKVGVFTVYFQWGAGEEGHWATSRVVKYWPHDALGMKQAWGNPERGGVTQRDVLYTLWKVTLKGKNLKIHRVRQDKWGFQLSWVFRSQFLWSPFA